MMNCLQVYKPKMKRFAETALQTGINPSNAVAHLLNHTLNIHLMKSEFHFILFSFFHSTEFLQSNRTNLSSSVCHLSWAQFDLFHIFFIVNH